MRSFGLNYEVLLTTPDPDVVARVCEVEDTSRELSPERTLEEWLARSRRSAYADTSCGSRPAGRDLGTDPTLSANL